MEVGGGVLQLSPKYLKTEVLIFHPLGLYRQQLDNEKTSISSDLNFQAYISSTRKPGAKCSKAKLFVLLQGHTNKPTVIYYC